MCWLMIYRRQVGHGNTFAGTGVSRPINPLQDGEGGADGGGRVGIYMKVSESHISLGGVSYLTSQP